VEDDETTAASLQRGVFHAWEKWERKQNFDRKFWSKETIYETWVQMRGWYLNESHIHRMWGGGMEWIPLTSGHDPEPLSSSYLIPLSFILIFVKLHNFSNPSDNAKLEASTGHRSDCPHWYRDSNPISDTRSSGKK
jgi:hypothetical protein